MRIIGVDTGGTFTDFIYQDAPAGSGGQTTETDGPLVWKAHKRLSTPDDPSRAALEGVAEIVRLTGWTDFRITHGSTVATNAILERKGAACALITNAGFEDVIEIGRQNRSRLYDLRYRKSPHIVPASLRFGLSCRTDADGAAVSPLDPEELLRLREALARSGAVSAAVCLLFSYLDPSMERAVGEALAPLGLSVSLSHEILAEFREFERTSTTVVNAYVAPVMAGYVERFDRAAGPGRLRIMQSNGGAISASTAMREPVRTILSGPAGGAAGALLAGRAAGCERLIAFDMGGTSTDVCLIDGELPMTMESEIAGYPVKAPMIAIHTVGAGGGSIARLDPGGALLAGPHSAGADPGPACYGKGEEVTVTDANLYLGRLVPERFLGGAMRLYPDRAARAIETLAARAGLSPRALAEGVLDVANANMERAIRVISVERGHDPREFALFSFGGAGGMHCAFLARLLGIREVLVPKNPGILSAVGMAAADVIKDYSLTVMRDGRLTAKQELEALFAPLEERAAKEMAGEGFGAADVRFERALDMRYLGQSFEIVTPFVEDFAEAFEALHERVYGYRNAGRGLQAVNIRLRASASPEKPRFAEAGNLTPDIPDAAFLGETRTVFDGREFATRVVDRERLLPGNALSGPAILTEMSATLVVPPFARAAIDAFGNCRVRLAPGAPGDERRTRP